MPRMPSHFPVAVITALFSTLLTTGLPVSAQLTITPCTSGFNGKDIALSERQPHDAFIASGSVVKHVSRVLPGSRSCGFGSPLPDIALGVGVAESWGVALDNSKNLFVAAGSGIFTITNILQIAPPYTGPPTVFFSSGTNLRSLAIHGNILYAADLCAGTVLRFDLTVGPSSVTTFASVPGVFGIFAAGVDDLFVTSNAGFTGCASGVGSNDVEHVTTGGVDTVATGLSFPEGVGGDEVNLYIAAGTVVFTVPIDGGTPSFYAGSPILFSHGVTVWKGGGYVTDSNPPGHVFKFTLL